MFAKGGANVFPVKSIRIACTPVTVRIDVMIKRIAYERGLDDKSGESSL